MQMGHALVKLCAPPASLNAARRFRWHRMQYLTEATVSLLVGLLAGGAGEAAGLAALTAPALQRCAVASYPLASAGANHHCLLPPTLPCHSHCVLRVLAGNQATGVHRGPGHRGVWGV